MWEILAKALGQPVGINFVVRTGGKLFPETALAFQLGPALGIGCTAHFVDELQLVCLVLSLEKAGSAEHFGNDTTNTPHIDLGGVIDHAQEQFGWSVPQGYDLVGQSLHFRVPASGKAPIGNLEFTIAVDQEIRCFKIAVNDLILVHVMDSVEELLRPGFDMVLCQSDFRGFQDTGQIVFQILKDHKYVFGEGSIRSLFFSWIVL